MERTRYTLLFLFPLLFIFFYQLEITPDAVKRMQALHNAVQSCSENATLESETISCPILVATRVAINFIHETVCIHCIHTIININADVFSIIAKRIIVISLRQRFNPP